MRNFDKLANLHSVFFKKAANPDYKPRLPAYKSKEPTQGGSVPYEGNNGPLTPFAGGMGIPKQYNQDQVRRQLGIQSGAGAAGKMLGGAVRGGIPGALMSATPNLMAAGAAFNKDMPGAARAALNAPKPVNLDAPNPMPEDNPIDRLGRNRNVDYQGTPASESGFGAGNAPVPKKLGRP